MWDKDTWPNNRSNTSVKLLWLFGLVERSHCWPSAGLRAFTDLPSHMIRLRPAERLKTRAFCHSRSRTVECVERPRSSRMTALIPVKPRCFSEAHRVLKRGWKSWNSAGKTHRRPTREWEEWWKSCSHLWFSQSPSTQSSNIQRWMKYLNATLEYKYRCLTRKGLW